MSEEKHNESFRWQTKLEELDQLCGEPVIDKSVSWNKLHARLGAKPGYKKLLWYWLPAACILIVVGLQGIIADRKGNEIVAAKNQSKREQQVRQTHTPKEQTAVSDSNRITSEEPQGRQATAVRAITKSLHASKDLPAAANEIQPDTDSSKRSLETELVQAIAPGRADSTSSVLALPAKRKLRVIHINELQNLAEEKMQYVRSPDPANDLRRHGLSVFSVTKNASDDIVKIKLSPSN